MYCWIIHVQDTQWIRLKVKTIKKKHMKSAKFNCLILMTKYVSKAMDMTD